MSASSSEMSSGSDSEPTNSNKGAVRVGSGYQATIPDYCLPKPAPTQYPEKAVKVWTPDNSIEDDKIREYLHIAHEKYNYNPEQALGVLYWHKFDLECALADLANYLPYPDEWSMEDRALFEQAYQFYNKNFHKINTLLPDKKISSLVKFYYTWKKVKTQSYIQRQINKKPSQTKDDSNDSVGNDAVVDSETEFEANGSTSGLKQECSLCQTRKSTNYFNTNQGLLCRSCFSSKRKDGSFNANSNNEEFHFGDECKNPKDDSCLPNGMTKLILDRKVLVEIAREREANISRKAVDVLDMQITDVIRQIREHKQKNAAIKESLIEMPDMPVLNQNNNRVISRWNDSEILIFTIAISDYGSDFKTIAEILGNKTESQIRQYYLANKDRFKGVMAQHYAENDLEEELEAEDTEELRSGRSGK